MLSEVSDPYVSGMVEWQEEDDSVLDRLRAWQLQLLRPYLGKRILEIGAGNGKFARLLSANHVYEKYVALEPSKHFYAGLQKTQLDLKSLEIVNCTLTELQSASTERFDVVFSIHVMEHIEDDYLFLRQCYDLVVPGGYVVVLVPALSFLYSKLDRKIGHYRRYDRAMIASLAKQYGANLVLNRYDNFIGVLGWLWVCKLRGIDYHSSDNKKALLRYFNFFLKIVLPLFSWFEKIIPPPVGLNLTAVLQKPIDRV